MAADTMPFVDGNGQRRSWHALCRVADRNVRRRMPYVDRELRADAVQEGRLSLLAAIDRDWFRHQTAGALDFERCVLHVTARARRYIARECKKQARTASRLDEEREKPDPTNYTPEEAVASEDITHLVRQLRASMPVDLRAECDLLLGTLTQGEIAARLGVSQQAVSERVARLKAKVRALAIAAGILGSGGYYDTQT